MTPDRWLQVEAIFSDAIAVPHAERDAWLQRACGDDTELLEEVRSLLASDDVAASRVATPIREAVLAFDRQEPNRRVGPYELLEEVGRGGMGTVYRAQRVDDEYQSIVAIKLVRPGMDADFVLRRFRRERQTLARLTHPSIARLLDGGTTEDGIPYIVMEYIDGVWITAHCREHGLSLGERIELFLQVCSAVDYAHRHFIIHHDIKPGNILIDQTGTPKLLDFGISKQLAPGAAAPVTEQDGEQTQGIALLTPDYASPEQANNQPTSPQSDVYSLGAVLYEMLTGSKAHRAPRTNIQRPSDVVTDRALSRRLAGDVDKILMRALHMEPDCRYESAAAFADDLRRYLNDLPVRARPRTTAYRMRKFVLRNRSLVGGTMAAFVALAVTTAVAVAQARRAEAREGEVRSLARVFMYDVHDSIRDLPGATAARQKIVETALRYLDALAQSGSTEPELLRELASGYVRIGDIQGSDQQGANLGDPKSALASYRKASAALATLVGRPAFFRQASIDMVVVQRQIAEMEFSIHSNPQALASLTAAADVGRRLMEHYPGDREIRLLVSEVLMTLGQRLRVAGDLRSSLTTTTAATDILRALAEESAPTPELRKSIANGESALGMTMARLDMLADARTRYERAAAENEHLVALDPNNVSFRRNLALDYVHIGDVLGLPSLPNLGDAAGAEGAYRRGVELQRQLHELDPRDARAKGDYAQSLVRLGLVIPHTRSVDKERYLRQSLELMESLAAQSRENVGLRGTIAAVERELGDVFRERSDRRQAALYYRRALNRTEPLVDLGTSGPPRTFVSATSELAKLEAADGRGTEAVALLDRARVVAERLASQRADDLLAGGVLPPRVYAAYAKVHAQLGNDADATQWQSRAAGAWKELSTQEGFTTMLRREMEAFFAEK